MFIILYSSRMQNGPAVVCDIQNATTRERAATHARSKLILIYIEDYDSKKSTLIVGKLIQYLRVVYQMRISFGNMEH